MRPDPIRTSSPPLLLVFGALLALLALSAASCFLPPAGWKTAASLVIAAVKAGLIVLFFMRLGRQRGLIRIVAAAGFFWLAILATLVCADYLMRGRL